MTEEKAAKLGDVVIISIKKLHPTQTDDGQLPLTSGPIQVYIDNDKFYILHGHHRYYDKKFQGFSTIEGRISKNPYNG